MSPRTRDALRHWRWRIRAIAGTVRSSAGRWSSAACFSASRSSSRCCRSRRPSLFCLTWAERVARRFRRDYKKDPDVPHHVANHESTERHADGAQESPVRAGDRRRSDERHVLGHDVRATVERRRGQVACAALHKTAPEELFRRPDHEAEARGELLLRPEGTKRVDVADLLAPTRHDLARDRVADAKDPVEPHGGRQSNGDLTRPDPRAAGVAVRREREPAKDEPRRRHAVPESGARPAEREAERRERGADAEREELHELSV